MGNLSERARLLCAVAMALGVSASLGCSEAKKVGDAVTDAIETDVTGLVQDDQGEPVVGATVRLYGLLDNTSFVEGGDVESASAYIDREAVLASNNTLGTGQTG